MTEKPEAKISESSIARIAGNILSGMVPNMIDQEVQLRYVKLAVQLAREVAAEVERTRP